MGCFRRPKYRGAALATPCRLERLTNLKPPALPGDGYLFPELSWRIYNNALQ